MLLRSARARKVNPPTIDAGNRRFCDLSRTLQDGAAEPSARGTGEGTDGEVRETCMQLTLIT